MTSTQGLQVTSEIKDIDSLVRLSGRMECESPNRHLYEFVGNIRLERDRWGHGRPLATLLWTVCFLSMCNRAFYFFIH
jgi:hypothetical protein